MSTAGQGVWLTVLAVTGVTIVGSVVRSIVRRLGATRTKRTADGVKTLAEIPKIEPWLLRVVAIGPSGSGKSVMLSSMFRELRTTAPGRSYLLSASVADSNYLNGLFSQVSSPGKPWPLGTRRGDTREFTFNCKSKHGPQRDAILRINYLDYAGELLQSETNASNPILLDLESRIGKADALLGIIDGWQVRQLMTRVPGSHESFQESIGSMVGILAEHRSPVQLIITKWDLLRGVGEPDGASEDERLRFVSKYLTAETEIGRLVDTRQNSGYVLRVIPVSAVGTNFARLQGPAAHQSIGKLTDGHINPINIEVPFAAILPDLLRTHIMSMETKMRAEIERGVREAMALRPRDSMAAFLKVLSAPTGPVLRWATSLVSGSDLFAAEVSTAVVDWMRRPLDKKVKIAESVRGEAEEYLKGLQQAREHLVDELGQTISTFERTYTSSVVSGEW